MTAARLGLVLASCLAVGCDRSTRPDDGPDPRPIVYFRRDDVSGIGWTLAQVDPTGGPPRQLRVSTGEAVYPALSPEGSRLAFVSETNPTGVYVGSADGSGARLVYPLEYASDTDHITWSPDGTKLAFGVGNDVVVASADGGGAQTITSAVDIVAGYPAWSSTGRIAFTSAARFESPPRSDIYTMAADGSDVRLIVSGEGQEARDPAWSPDGSRLAFAHGRHGASSIYTVDATGNDRRRVTWASQTGFGWTDLGPAWSPSGRWIAFQREHRVCTGAECAQRYDVFIVPGSGEGLNLTAGSPWGGVRPTW